MPARYSVVSAAILTCVAVLQFGCSSERRQSSPDDPTIAVVEGEKIPASWYRQTYFDYLIKTGGNDTRGNRYLHLDNLIDALLLGQEARRRGYADDSLSAVYVERATKKALGGRFYDEEFVRTIQPLTDAEVRRAFANWKTEIVARHLFYLSPDSADAAYRRLQEGADFLEEARRCYGLAAIDSSAGFLGPLRYFMVDDAVAEAAFGLEVGEFSPPVRSRFGYHIIRAEDRIRNPLLTEAEYQTRRSGIEKRERLRRARLGGDEFVRAFMTGVNVQINAPAVLALNALILESERSVEPQPVDLSSGESGDVEDVSDLAASLDLATPLATYQWRGKERVFTLGDYFFWMPTLPYAERRSRTGASVGRAMRNEIFAMEGKERRLGGEQLEASVRRETALFLARRLLADLRADTTATPTDEQLQQAFQRFEAEKKGSVTTDFWMVPFESLDDARQARDQISKGRLDPAAIVGFTRRENVRLSDEAPELAYYVRQSPVDEVNVVGLAGGVWIVLKVTRKVSTPTTYESARADLEKRLRPYINEYNVLRTLRRDASVSIDTLAFEQVIDLE